MWTLTEQHDVDRPIVYGYLRLHRSTPERQAALTVALAQYCDQHELRLCGIFTDQGTVSVVAPAFAGLLDVLPLSGAYGVVLPSAHHLGGKQVAARRREQLKATGARLLFVRGPLRTALRRTDLASVPGTAEPSVAAATTRGPATPSVSCPV
ncbi:hypothetical protein [Nonomuraea zeae]|uniref:hypothetical protein n=1 Tax=Nonomuraea zeae TaxID=1642303 RepID=UPI00197D706D|nr:hypothetical protein [Nonomuraea zeae]